MSFLLQFLLPEKASYLTFLVFFAFYAIFIRKENVDMNTITTPQKQYKRQDRSVSPETRQKISQTLKGKSKSITHRTHISQGVANYWRQIPPKKEEGTISY